MRENKYSSFKFFSDKVTINLDVFGPFIEYGIFRDVRATWLSQNNFMSLVRKISKETRKDPNQNNSLLANAIDEYFTYYDDLNTIICFLAF